MSRIQRKFTVGLDLGQRQDPTALTAIEHAEGDEAPYHCRHAQRFELGTPYPEIVEAVRELIRRPEMKVHRRSWGPKRGALIEPNLVVDATGVGAPIVEMLREEGLSPIAIWITGGDSVGKDGREYRVPKRDLVSTIQALLQSGRLKFAEQLPFREVLTEELQKFRAKIDVDTGNASFEHWRERDHDDLVLALACACWHAERGSSSSDRPYVSSRF